VARDRGRGSRLQTERRVLEKAQRKAHEQLGLVTELYRLDEELDVTASKSRTRLLEIQKQIALAQKQIEELEIPRDDSLDNSVSYEHHLRITSVYGLVSGLFCNPFGAML